MNCKVCEPLLGRVVPMERVVTQKREVTGSTKRANGGWSYDRKILKTVVKWYCPNSFQHTVTETNESED